MLKSYSAKSAALPPQSADRLPAIGKPIWIDLLDPTDAEQAEAESLLGAGLPSRDQISAIELSSRLNSDDRILRLNLPSFVRAEGGHGVLTPLGFVLTPELLVSIRYADALSFQHMSELSQAGNFPATSVDTFVTLLEAIVNVGADRIEAISGELSRLSRAVFSETRDQRHVLRTALFKLGGMQRQTIQTRLAMLGVSRVVSYLCEVAPPWIDQKYHAQFRTVQSDVGSLAEFDQQLNDRIQFLLDAVLGFINNDQNDIMKVLTIVSVVTIPPMILAGIWGMNFKSISEYDWPHGYAMALTVMAISVLVPLGIFKWKRWF